MSRPNRHLDLPGPEHVVDGAAGNHHGCRRVPLDHRSSHRLATLAWLMVLVSHPGCVALNLPSERYHDPDDLGGMLGRWKHARGPMPPSYLADDPTYSTDAPSFLAGDPSHLAGDPSFLAGKSYAADDVAGWEDVAGSEPAQECEAWVTHDEFACDPFASLCDPFASDDSSDPEPVGKQKPVPWPKYHPVPTRPVFGGTDPFGSAP